MTRFVIVLVCLLSACADNSDAPLLVRDVVITETIPGQSMSAGFMTFENNSDDVIVIDTISSDRFARVAIHETTIEDGIARMRPLDTLSIPANSSITLERGGIHLMLMKPEAREASDKSVSLSFYGDQTLLLSIATQTTSGAR